MNYLQEHYTEIFKKYSNEEIIKDIEKFKYEDGSLQKTLNQFFEEIIFKCCGKKSDLSPWDALQDETEHIKNFAKKNNFKLYIVDIKNFGKDYFPDNPFKNELILCALTEIGYNLNIKNIMLGATGTYHIENSKIGINVTDTIENYNTFISGLKKYYNNVNLFFLEKNLTKNKMIEYIIKYHKDSLEDIYSCISPNRFVKMLHNNNESKYNIKLLKDRCGSCYKCCMEYILLYENGYYNNKEFLNHCYEILAKSKNSHSPQLFNLKIPYEQRRKNVLGYKPE